MKLDLSSLAYRRSRGDMIEIFKIIGGVYDKDYTEDVFKKREVGITRGNNQKLYTTRARLDLRKYAFPRRVVNIWNSLPNWVIYTDAVEKFEALLDKYWKHQGQKFDYSEQISTTLNSQ